MNVFTPAGSITNAFSHFALIGLAAICHSELRSPVTLWWSRERFPRPHLDAAADPQTIAEAVHRHAARLASPDSWLTHSIDHEGRATAVFSPRIKEPTTPAAWRSLQTARHDGLNDLLAADNTLDLSEIGALGEPAYWPTGRTPDAGASRWEMKTRNRGEEFVGNRLAPLAQHVATRNVDEVLTGLTGQTINDEAGRNQADSRTATGLSRPGPVDNALAWCALWAISQFPVVHHIDAQSTTAGTIVDKPRTHPSLMFLPVPIQPLTVARLRTVLASRQLLRAASASDNTEPLNAIEVSAAKKWLTERSIPILMRFNVHVSDNPSAPERQVLEGAALSLTEQELPSWTQFRSVS